MCVLLCLDRECILEISKYDSIVHAFAILVLITSELIHENHSSHFRFSPHFTVRLHTCAHIYFMYSSSSYGKAWR